MAERTAVVAGATGLVGRYILAHLVRTGACEALSRRTLKLEQVMEDNAPVGQRIVAKRRLEPCSYDQLVRWRHGGFVFTPEFDIMSATSKLQRAGFHAVVDSEAMFFRLFNEYRRARIIP